MQTATKRSVNVHVRMSADERSNLLRFSEILGISPSDLIRRAVPTYAAQLLNRKRRSSRKETA